MIIAPRAPLAPFQTSVILLGKMHPSDTAPAIQTSSLLLHGVNKVEFDAPTFRPVTLFGDPASEVRFERSQKAHTYFAAGVRIAVYNKAVAVATAAGDVDAALRFALNPLPKKPIEILADRLADEIQKGAMLAAGTLDDIFIALTSTSLRIAIDNEVLKAIMETAPVPVEYETVGTGMGNMDPVEVQAFPTETIWGKPDTPDFSKRAFFD
ncbi:MAG: hypothetical protein COX62_05210 [Deltaproteobacteria bacterium CG_4_10_14_0_2_um_filter_43_8]|nr:MAG: hypothetical protein COV43_06470 [Deltaproteobacteria bacterium CG11_big_fil_rev_8_21_14_0_20_42_23]PJA20151.1 MAG: hypothetical protein COX62_05210 [Deltaproteobacteria bacterium CG_4_10_14_0_2_um_filter_43_8]PJC64070.1 MAG: hypothetical protein CO021_06165 [Deltaproteobacteria bacterium CG_4_9_14_0_2_um_filter_42_21]